MNAPVAVPADGQSVEEARAALDLRKYFKFVYSISAPKRG